MARKVKSTPTLAQLIDEIRAWNNADIRGIDDISPNVDMLKARRGVINTLARMLADSPFEVPRRFTPLDATGYLVPPSRHPAGRDGLGHAKNAHVANRMPVITPGIGKSKMLAKLIAKAAAREKARITRESTRQRKSKVVVHAVNILPKEEPLWLVHMHYGEKSTPLTVYDNHDGTYTYADGKKFNKNIDAKRALALFTAKMNAIALGNVAIHG